MQPTVINVNTLTKIYPLYRDPTDRLKEALHPFRKKYHSEFYALRDISFDIQRGETVGIIGQNGSGKSTLLKILTGVLTPTSGHAGTLGRILALLELGAGFNPELSGIENIFFNGSLYGVSRQEMEAKLDAILEFADIGDFVHQPIKTYSSGMVVRLAFAVIANMDAEILIIDEALSVGDAFFVQKCMRFLRKFIERGTLLFVSHDTSAVVNLCSRAIWLDGGVLRADGTPKDVAEKYLEALIAKQQNEEDQKKTVSPQTTPEASIPQTFKDMRQDFINTTQYRNDIELFQFDEDAKGFGQGGARIRSVHFTDLHDQPLSWIVGGEMVRLTLTADIVEKLYSPILGFYVKDRLGQILFGENTYNFSKSSPPQPEAGEKLSAVFEFALPILPAGEYSVTVALAEGSQDNHVQHHWIHDALIFTSHSSSASTGLMGIPMHNIRFQAYS